MTNKPEGETVFELFCNANHILWQRVQTGLVPTPDYLVFLSGAAVYVEIKQVDADEDFRPPSGVSSRTVGSHVRQKIADSRKQMQAAASAGNPGVLLVYNNLDPMQLFGTESHDFVSAMYGEMTVRLKGTQITDSFYGRNSLLREGHNRSFSAVGHLRSSPTGPTIRIFENVFARYPLDFPSLPECIGAVRIEVAEDAA